MLIDGPRDRPFASKTSDASRLVRFQSLGMTKSRQLVEAEGCTTDLVGTWGSLRREVCTLTCALISFASSHASERNASLSLPVPSSRVLGGRRQSRMGGRAPGTAPSRKTLRSWTTPCASTCRSPPIDLRAQARPLSLQLREFTETPQRALRPFADRFDVRMTIDGSQVGISASTQTPTGVLAVKMLICRAGKRQESWYRIIRSPTGLSCATC